MSITRTFLLAACASTAGLALAGCGGGGATATEPGTTAPPETTAPAAVTTVPPATTTTAPPTATVTAATRISVRIEGGRPVRGIRRATVKKGARVVLVVRSDVADEVHLHGYDLHRDVEAGGTARIAFTASLTGVFEAEIESRGLQIAEVDVRP